MAVNPNVDELTQELIDLIKLLPEFTTKGFSIFDLQDLETILQYESLPLVGVTYEGCNPVTGSTGGKTSVSKTSAMLVISFSIILALRYGSAIGAGDDTKVDAVNLLDSIRNTVMGYKGVNRRGWSFNGETPIASGIEGVIFYGQTWSVRLPVTGNFGI